MDRIEQLEKLLLEQGNWFNERITKLEHRYAKLVDLLGKLENPVEFLKSQALQPAQPQDSPPYPIRGSYKCPKED